MGRSSKQNVNKDIVALNNDLDEMDLTDIHSTFHSNEAKYTLLSKAHEIFSKTDHMIGHKTSFNNSRQLTSYQALSLSIRG